MLIHNSDVYSDYSMFSIFAENIGDYDELVQNVYFQKLHYKRFIFMLQSQNICKFVFAILSFAK